MAEFKKEGFSPKEPVKEIREHLRHLLSTYRKSQHTHELRLVSPSLAHFHRIQNFYGGIPINVIWHDLCRFSLQTLVFHDNYLLI